jgi:signal transduction histidine kinase
MDHPLLPVADLAVAAALTGWGALSWRRSRSTSMLLLAAGGAWLLAGWWPAALFWHRALLVHATLGYPGWRPASRASIAVVGTTYLLAVAFPVSLLDDRVSAALGIGLLAAAALDVRRTRGRARHHRGLALIAGGMLGGVLVASAIARALTERDLSVPTLIAYELAVVATTVVLAAGLAPPKEPEVVDLVLDLGEAGSDTLRDELARALRDPHVEIGYWNVDAGAFLTAAGTRVEVAGSGRVGVEVHRGGGPYALLALEPGMAQDPGILASIQTATRISAANARRQQEVLEQVAELAASRRRLLVAADDERRRLAAELRLGVVRRLETLQARLAPLRLDEDVHVGRAVEHLGRTVDDLGDVAAGLRPRDLEQGLADGLARLQARAPLGVTIQGTPGPLPPEVELAAWYVCTEALSNTAKHAPGSTLRITLERTADTLEVTAADDGPGGAGIGERGGLLGLADRVQSLGGSLSVGSGAGGTRLHAELPVGGQG